MVTIEKAAKTSVKTVLTGLEFLIFDSSGAIVKSSNIHHIFEGRVPLISFGVGPGFWKSTPQVALFSFGLDFPCCPGSCQDWSWFLVYFRASGFEQRELVNRT